VLSGALGGGLPPFACFHDSLVQGLLQQRQHPAVRDLFPYAGQQLLLRDAVEVSFEIRVHRGGGRGKGGAGRASHPRASSGQTLLHHFHGLPGAAPRAKAVTALREVPLEDRLKDMQQRTLHDPVAHGRDAQRPLFATAELVDPRAPHRLWFITALLQQPGEQGDFLLGPCTHGLCSPALRLPCPFPSRQASLRDAILSPHKTGA
jgi:hypothetical protein